MFRSHGGLLAQHRSLCVLQVALFAFVLFASTFTATAQGGVDSMGTGGKHRIQGRIYFPSGRRSDASSVKVILDSTSSERLFVIADLNGSFAFNSLAPGSYTLTIEAGPDYEIARERVVIESSGVRSRSMSGADLSQANIPRIFNVMINLQLKPAVALKAAVINAALANVPDKALTAYQKALELDHAGDSKKAVDQLKIAIAIYPSFTWALNQLGVQYLKLGQPDRAAEALSATIKLAPEDFLPRLNYGVALLNQRRFSDAEQQLRIAVNKNASVPTAHMYLGITLAIQRKLDEANKELETAINSHSTDVALAHRYLGGVFLERRDYKRAADQLETYLKMVPKATDSEVLTQKIKELRSKS